MSHLDQWTGRVARNAVRALARVYYRRIEVIGREKIPVSGPVLLCANHPNSLMDAVILGLVARRPVHFLAKAPLFDVPLFGSVLRALGMLPAYRGQDDRSQVSANMQTLADAAGWLARGDGVGIFPEGKSHDAARVEQVRTGAARIAMQAAQGGCRGLLVAPVGINYERKERFRSVIWVCVGDPMDADAWLAQHGGEERRAMRTMTGELDRRLKAVAVHIEAAKWEPFLEDLELLAPAEDGEISDSMACLRRRKRIADAMNYFLATDKVTAEDIAAQIQAHRERLSSAGITMDTPALRARGEGWSAKRVRELVGLLVWLAPALAGTVHHLLPFLLTRAVAGRLQYPGRTTISHTRLLVGLPIYALWYAGVALWMTGHCGAWPAVIWLLTMPAAGVVALNYGSWFCAVGRRWVSEMDLRSRPNELARLQFEHEQLRNRLGELSKAYRQSLPLFPS